MSKLKYNPKLLICEYFDKIINLIDIHTEKQLEKYSDRVLIDQPFEYEFKELAKFLGYRNRCFFRFEERNKKEMGMFSLTYNDLDNLPKKKIKPGTIRVSEYLNKTRDELIDQVRKYEEQALS